MPSRLDDIPLLHWDFLESTLPYHETENHFFVHANADPDLPLADQSEFMLYWEPFGNPKPHISGKTMVCGHTSQKSGNILDVGHAVCIDTFAWDSGWLTCLDVDSGKYWQVRENGERQEGMREVTRL